MNIEQLKNMNMKKWRLPHNLRFKLRKYGKDIAAKYRRLCPSLEYLIEFETNKIIYVELKENILNNFILYGIMYHMKIF